MTEDVQVRIHQTMIERVGINLDLTLSSMCQYTSVFYLINRHTLDTVIIVKLCVSPYLFIFKPMDIWPLFVTKFPHHHTLFPLSFLLLHFKRTLSLCPIISSKHAWLSVKTFLPHPCLWILLWRQSILIKYHLMKVVLDDTPSLVMA